MTFKVWCRMYELFHAHQCRFVLFVCLHCVPYSKNCVCMCLHAFTPLTFDLYVYCVVLCERAFVRNSTDGNYVALVMHRHTFSFASFDSQTWCVMTWSQGVSIDIRSIWLCFFFLLVHYFPFSSSSEFLVSSSSKKRRLTLNRHHRNDWNR